MATEWQIRAGTAADLVLLERLWVSVHHRHAETMPDVAPYVSDSETWVPDTWATGKRIGEIESLSVLRQYRGSGLGSELLQRLEEHLYSLGVDDLILGALSGNTEATRLYERRGYRPTWLYLSRFKDRN